MAFRIVQILFMTGNPAMGSGREETAIPRNKNFRAQHESMRPMHGGFYSNGG